MQVEYNELKKSKHQGYEATAREITSASMLDNLLEETSGGYFIGVCSGALVGLSHIFIGAVIISVVLYSNRMQDNHAAWFTIAEPDAISIRNLSRGSRVSFASPVNVRVIENSGVNYSKTVGWAIAIGISQVLIGVIVMSTIIYSVHKQEFHGALFSITYNFFVAEGILSLSFINGWSTPMRRKHRKCAHVVLQVGTITCAAIGLFAISGKLPHSRTVHGFTGLITLVLTGMNWMLGPFLLQGHIHIAQLGHMVVGIACFLMSSLCLCTGLVTAPFKTWAGVEVTGILMAFVIFYSFCVVFTTLMKSVKRS